MAVLFTPCGQKTHAATFEFSGTKRVWESSCPQVTVSVVVAGAQPRLFAAEF